MDSDSEHDTQSDEVVSDVEEKDLTRARSSGGTASGNFGSTGGTQNGTTEEVINNYNTILTHSLLAIFYFLLTTNLDHAVSEDVADTTDEVDYVLHGFGRQLV